MSNAACLVPAFRPSVNTPVLQGGLKKNTVWEGLQTSPKQTIKTPSLREGSSRIRQFSSSCLFAAGLILLMFLTFSGPKLASAQERDFGIGLMAGEPTGLTLKHWIDSHSAIDGAVGWSFGDSDDVAIHASYLLHKFNSTAFPGHRIPLYFGVGARLLLEDGDDDRFGIRVPVGISYMFSGDPFDIFAEVAPVIDVAPSAELDLSAGVGMRFYFDSSRY